MRSNTIEQVSYQLDPLFAPEIIVTEYEGKFEYALSMYLQHDDKYAKLFYDGAEHYSELKKIKDKLFALDDDTDNKNNDDSYEQAINTIRRIHSGMNGYIGKNQIRDVAKTYDLSPTSLIKYVESMDEFDVRRFGAIPK